MAVFQAVRILNKNPIVFKSNLTKIFPILQEAVEASIKRSKPVPADIQSIFIPVLRDAIYEQCTWYQSFNKDALGLSCYFSKDKVIWELELK